MWREAAESLDSENIRYPFRLRWPVRPSEAPDLRSVALKAIGDRRNLRTNSGPVNACNLHLLASRAFVTAMSLNARSRSAAAFSLSVITTVRRAPLAGGAYVPTPFVGMYAPFGIGSRRHAKERHVCATRDSNLWRGGKSFLGFGNFYLSHHFDILVARDF